MTAALHFILIFELRSEHAVSYWKRSLIFFQWDCVHHFPCYYYPFQYERWGCWGRLRARRECARRGARRKFKNRFSCVAGFFGCRSYNKNIFLSSQASAVPIHSSLFRFVPVRCFSSEKTTEWNFLMAKERFSLPPLPASISKFHAEHAFGCPKQRYDRQEEVHARVPPGLPDPLLLPGVALGAQHPDAASCSERCSRRV